MEIKFNVTGKSRKNLVEAISQTIGAEAKYKGVPSCSYEVDYFKIDRFGTLSFEGVADSKEIKKLLETLEQKGFTAELQEATTLAVSSEEVLGEQVVEAEEESTQTGSLGLTVAMPRSYFTNGALTNMENILKAKGSLIKKALELDKLPMEVSEEQVAFPWFSIMPKCEETVNAYTHFISALCEMAKNQKRIQAKEKEIENEKYAFRCFLLRLGFLGISYKAERKVLLKNFTGSSAFREMKK